jgi:hypothetical protein
MIGRRSRRNGFYEPQKFRAIEAAKTCWACVLDAERILSMQRNIAGLHAKRSRLPSLEARLREWAHRPTQVELTRGATGEENKLDDSYSNELSSR